MTTSKAEYLKRYLSGPDSNDTDGKKKKRRKKVKAVPQAQGLKILDEDIDLSCIPNGDVNQVDDEEPTIAEIIDERPEEVKIREAYANSKLWKTIKDNKSPLPKQSDQSPLRRQRHDSDQSPCGKHQHNSDQSPPRRQRHDSDQSPPRRQRHDSDQSPPRRQRHDSDQSPPRRQRHDSDQSPPRKHRHESDQSPPRRHRQTASNSNVKESDSDQSPPRRRNNDSDSDQSPPRKKTLSGKAAGLSSAADMKKEAEKLKQKETAMFEKIGDEALGRGAKTVVRDRATGKKRDLAAEKELTDEKLQQWKAKYDTWAKGVKQGEADVVRASEILYEMSKPLARSADDADLDAHLREQEREGDPMLAFIKKKKEKKSKAPKYPTYKGTAPPNRYNIRPGYRWDGVDRSNGFEKKYFLSISHRQAVASEAYKWSTENM